MSTNQFSILQIRAAMLGEGLNRIFGTLQIGHTRHAAAAGYRALAATPHGNNTVQKYLIIHTNKY